MPAVAQFFTQKVVAPDGASGDRFGSAISQNSEWLVVAAPEADTPGLVDSGAVYVYRRVGTVWTFHTKLTSPNAENGGQFGFSVDTQRSLSSTTPRAIVVGAKFEDAAGPDSGAVHVFWYSEASDTWNLFASPIPPGVGPGDNYGQSVQIVRYFSGANIVAASAMRDDDRGNNAGAVYVFQDTSSFFFKYFASDAEAGDLFGVSVSLRDTNRMLVGSIFEDTNGNSAGAAYLWDSAFLATSNPADEDVKLLAPDGAPDDFFGVSVALSYDGIVIGAEGDDDNGSFSGSVYVWEYSTGSGVGSLIKRTAPGGAQNDDLGFQVSADESGWVAGMRASSAQAVLGGGSIRAFGGGSLANLVPTTLFPPDIENFDAAGSAVYTNGQFLFIGSPQDDDLGNNSGSVNAFYQSFVDCNGNGSHDHLEMALGQASDCDSNGVIDSCDIAVGNAEDCNANGVPDSCDLAFGTSEDCNQNQVLDECETDNDCNGNMIPDACDISSGISQDCNENGVPDDCDIAQGISLDADANGIPDECEVLGQIYCAPAVPNSTGEYAKIGAGGSNQVALNAFVLTLEDLPTNQFGFFLTSQTEGIIFPSGSDGILCLTGTTGRFNRSGEIWNSGAAGTAALVVDLTDFPPPVLSMVQPGQTWRFQAWYRDNSPGVVSNNFSDAVRVLFQ